MAHNGSRFRLEREGGQCRIVHDATNTVLATATTPELALKVVVRDLQHMMRMEFPDKKIDWVTVAARSNSYEANRRGGVQRR